MKNQVLISCFLIAISWGSLIHPPQQDSIQLYELIDKTTNENIPYATIQFNTGGGVVSNEDGVFQVNSTIDKSLTISAIGYKTKDLKCSENKNGLIQIFLDPVKYKLPEVEIKAKGFSANQIVEAAINRIPFNYNQDPTNAKLFYRVSSLTPQDSLVFQTESIFDLYDSKGYKQGHWRNIASRRYAEILQHRTVKGKPSDKVVLDWTFFSSDPILDNDEAISPKQLKNYEYKLLNILEYDSKEVYEIGFEKVRFQNSRYTTNPDSKYKTGKLFISKVDYALLRYVSSTHGEFTYEYKTPKITGWRGQLINRLTHERVEVYSKVDGKYHMEYGKVLTEYNQTTAKKNKDPEHANWKVNKEYQLFDIRTDSLKVLDTNLFDLRSQKAYNPEFWNQFNLVVK